MLASRSHRQIWRAVRAAMHETWGRARDCEPENQREVEPRTICGKLRRDSCWSKDGRYYNGASSFVPHASHTCAPALHWHRLDRCGCGKAASRWNHTIHPHEEISLFRSSDDAPWPRACCVGQSFKTTAMAPRTILPGRTDVRASSVEHQAGLLSLGM